MLVGNRSVLQKSPARFLSLGVACLRSNYNKPGMMRDSLQSLSELSGVPVGYVSPGSWFLPQRGGAMSSRNAATFDVTGDASGAMGVNGEGDAAFSFSASAIGQLIASAIGTATFTINAAGSLVAVLNGSGSASLTIDADALPTALGWIDGATEFSFSAELVSYAIGHMDGNAYFVDQINNPWTAEIEGGYTAAEVMRIMLAALSGVSSGVGTTTENYMATDGTTPRITTTFDSNNNRVSVTLDGNV